MENTFAVEHSDITVVDFFAFFSDKPPAKVHLGITLLYY